MFHYFLYQNLKLSLSKRILLFVDHSKPASIFLVENLVEMAALGPKTFFKQVFLALDFVVVLISFVLEIILKVYYKELAEIIGILVIFRIWRFVRIGHVSCLVFNNSKLFIIACINPFYYIVICKQGIIEVTSELTNEYYYPLIKYAMACEAQLTNNNIEKPKKTEHVSDIIKSICDHH